MKYANSAQLILDGVLFSGDWNQDQHPRDAHGHFAIATHGDAELRALLQAAPDDDLARAAAADKLDDLGRSVEANLLRQNEHPITVIGGGVFASPGVMEQVGPQSLFVFSNRPAGHRWTGNRRGYRQYKDQRGTYRMLVSTDKNSHEINAPGRNHPDYDAADISQRVQARQSWQPRDIAPGEEKVNAILHKIMEHQMTQEHGKMLVLTPREEKVLANYHKSLSGEEPGFPLVGSGRVSRVEPTAVAHKRLMDSLDQVIGHGRVSVGHPPSLRHYDFPGPSPRERVRRTSINGDIHRGDIIERVRRNSPGGYMDWSDAAQVADDVQQHLVQRGFADSDNSVLAPSRRHRDYYQNDLDRLVRMYMARRGHTVVQEGGAA